MATLNLETPWDTTPTSNSDFEIYDVDDYYILGNATDNTLKSDSTNFEDLEGGAPKGNIFIVYKNMLMIGGDPDFPHRIWYSHIRNAEGWSLDTDWIDVRPEDGGILNSFGVQNDELIVGKDNQKTYGWRIYEDGDPANSRLRLIEDDKSPINKDSLATLEDVLYYLDRNLIGSVPAGSKGGLSFIVQEIIDGIQSFNNVSVGVNDGKVYFFLGDVSINIGDVVELSDAVLVLDTVNAAFYLRDKTNARVWSKFIESDGSERLYFGDNSGRVFKMDEGTKAGNDPIHMRVRTKPLFRDLGSNITVSKVGVLMDDPDGTLVTYRTVLHQKFGKSVGSVVTEPIQWFEVDAEGPLFQLEFSHSNLNARPVLNGFILIYREEGEVKYE